MSTYFGIYLYLLFMPATFQKSAQKQVHQQNDQQKVTCAENLLAIDIERYCQVLSLRLVSEGILGGFLCFEYIILGI